MAASTGMQEKKGRHLGVLSIKKKFHQFQVNLESGWVGQRPLGIKKKNWKTTQNGFWEWFPKKKILDLGAGGGGPPNSKLTWN